MYVVFANPSGWPDRMRVRDMTQFESRRAKLAARGYTITVLSTHGTVRDTWDAMLKAQKKFKEFRYGP